MPRAPSVRWGGATLRTKLRFAIADPLAEPISEISALFLRMGLRSTAPDLWCYVTCARLPRQFPASDGYYIMHFQWWNRGHGQAFALRRKLTPFIPELPTPRAAPSLGTDNGLPAPMSLSGVRVTGSVDVADPHCSSPVLVVLGRTSALRGAAYSRPLERFVRRFDVYSLALCPCNRPSGHSPLGRDMLVLSRFDFSPIRKMRPTEGEYFLPKI
jgi:hypothetical protein